MEIDLRFVTDVAASAIELKDRHAGYSGSSKQTLGRRERQRVALAVYSISRRLVCGLLRNDAHLPEVG